MARVMTGGGFIHLLVEKVTYWYLCLISKISGLCQGFSFPNSLDIATLFIIFITEVLKECMKCIFIGVYIYRDLMKYLVTSLFITIFKD